MTLELNLEEFFFKAFNDWHLQWTPKKKIEKKFKGSLSNSKMESVQGSPSSEFSQMTLELNLEEFFFKAFND